MLKLVKYDFLRNRDQVLGLFVVMVLLQAGLWITSEVSAWGTTSLLLLSLGTYVTAGMVLLIQACRSFSYNLHSFSRNLLPVAPIAHIMSTLILLLLLLAGLTLIAILHMGIYLLYDASWLPEDFWQVLASSMLQMMWSAFFLMTILMLAITVAASVRTRGKVWMGIVIFFLLQNLLTLAEQIMFGNAAGTLSNAFQFHIESTVSDGMVVTRYTYNVWSTLFEVGVAAVSLWIITLLFKKRVEC
ncbi:hypothetical protein J7E73_26310 [Paenibacillus albidus]|uniref:hypothetical protein n=1 Tax=Paenibacillus albidus TaxID=2041023 RepID=UPI001BEBDC5A|nr:hypothetical protein [Paenibacillus albidus]MBT2292586.1 hypothetical protein [Paenibacillus albidus]